MADDAAASGAATEPTRLYNSSTQPRVVAWGNGVVMPGESFLTDNPEGYAPNQPNSPWTTDPETDALRGVLRSQSAQAGDTSEVAPDGRTEVQGASQTTPSGIPVTHMLGGLTPAPTQTLHTLPNGDVVNEAGVVVGHEDPTVLGHEDDIPSTNVPKPAQADQSAPVGDQSGGTA